VFLDFVVDLVETGMKLVVLALLFFEVSPFVFEFVDLSVEIIELVDGLVTEFLESIEHGVDLAHIDFAATGPADQALLILKELVSHRAVGRVVVVEVAEEVEIPITEVFVELNDGLKFVEGGFSLVTLAAKASDIGFDVVDLFVGDVGVLLTLVFQVGAFLLQGVDAFLMGVEFATDGIELPANII